MPQTASPQGPIHSAVSTVSVRAVSGSGVCGTCRSNGTPNSTGVQKWMESPRENRVDAKAEPTPGIIVIRGSGLRRKKGKQEGMVE